MKVIVLASQKGGVGKTTLTGNLAVAADLAGDGPSVLIDTDPQGSLSAWWNAREADSPALAPATLAGLKDKLKALEAAGFAYAVVDTPLVETDQRSLGIVRSLVVLPGSENDVIGPRRANVVGENRDRWLELPQQDSRHRAFQGDA